MHHRSKMIKTSFNASYAEQEGFGWMMEGDREKKCRGRNTSLQRVIPFSHPRMLLRGSAALLAADGAGLLHGARIQECALQEVWMSMNKNRVKWYKVSCHSKTDGLRWHGNFGEPPCSHAGSIRSRDEGCGEQGEVQVVQWPANSMRSTSEMSNCPTISLLVGLHPIGCHYYMSLYQQICN